MRRIKALARLWAVLLVLYMGFMAWYGGRDLPLTTPEVERLGAIFRERGGPELEERIRLFAHRDDGKEFFMLNLKRYRETARYEDGREASGTPQEVEQLYGAKMLPQLLRRACHPWAMVEPFATLDDHGIEGSFGQAVLVRYRSRRDFLEILARPEFAEDVVHKWAALEANMSVATRPVFTLLGPRTAVFMLLVGIGLLIQGRLRLRIPAEESAS